MLSIPNEERQLLHSRPQSPRSFWPVADRRLRPDPIFLSMRRAFASHFQPIRFPRFGGKSRTSGVGPDQNPWSLPQARRILGSGEENAATPEQKNVLRSFLRIQGACLGAQVKMQSAMERQWWKEWRTNNVREVIVWFIYLCLGKHNFGGHFTVKKTSLPLPAERLSCLHIQ